MLIKRIELENIKSYRQVAVDFRRGTTAISGANGAGKTTLVEAIGFALFGSLPYSQDQFVREGEKHGKVTVHIIGSDDRPYTVERRCGSGSRWMIYDEEADLRLEQRADVQDKLHDLFGIDRERPLDSLFRDALGVPQGTFTSIFLEPASKRKATFDALLQIEDYKQAAEKLLETQKYYQTQMQGQREEIQRLSYATAELEDWRTQLKDARLADTQQRLQHVEWSELFTQHEARLSVLNEQLFRLTRLEQEHAHRKRDYEHAQRLLFEREEQLKQAQSAEQITQESLPDHQLYEQAQVALKGLRQEAMQRDKLRQKMAHYKNEQARGEEKLNNAQSRVEEVVQARTTIVELAPYVEKQAELERQREEAGARLARYKALLDEGQRIKSQLQKVLLDQQQYEQRITAIEPLVPLAELLQERNELLTHLRVKAGEKQNLQRQLQEKRELLRERQMDRDQTADKLRRAEKNVELIEEHRQEAEEMPRLQLELESLAGQQHRLEGNIEAYTDSRAQSAGGQCPLLHETCLNIKQRGLVSLESYFDGLLQDEQSQLAHVQQQQAAIQSQIAQIKKYADALGKLGQYIEKRDMLAEQLQRNAVEIARLEREVIAFTQELEAVKQIEQQISIAEQAYNESKKADTSVRELASFKKQLQQLREQAQQLESDQQQRRAEAEPLRESEAQRNQIQTELQALNDPRSHSKAQQAIVAQENERQQQLDSEQQRQQIVIRDIQQLEEQLAVYQQLDEQIAQNESASQQSQAGHLRYLQNEREALRLPEYLHAQQQQIQLTEQAHEQLKMIEREYISAQAIFDRLELERIHSELERLRSDLTALRVRMQHHQELMTVLESQIEKAEALLIELEAAQKEYQTLEDLYQMTEQFRKLIKEAAPHVLKAMLADISAESNRIFGEVIGDKTAQLSWRNDYEIVLRRQGVDRSFAQLSGGEQMSAALSVRLALLKKLSTLNVAFFDEPTQNMDETRRMNLAEQIRRVRGFDQLLVISHDDTFEQGLDSLVRLNKVNGETHLYEENLQQRGDFQEAVLAPSMSAYDQASV
ncbi:AAA family ATPase [Tengunoibacter tsumagoiensis]|uniref:Nuclease SbcCD subunit C n=1 Tax=Tengunoibacter tsumagoiensis TaxID=2014871 RepID=A0A401ZVY8_9CHLR|nr:SMC family ATPase [Tengunoibacter tsumagoiensis]GCE11073.1 hypothetical protein KTT_09320 [Tengunoibacter tsumagoiensis]